MEGAYLGSPLVAEDGDRAAPGDSADVVPALAAHEAADSRLPLRHDLVQRPRPAVRLRRRPRGVLAELEEVGCFEPAGDGRNNGGHARRRFEARRSLHAVRGRRLLFFFLLGLFLALLALLFLFLGLKFSPLVAVHGLAHLWKGLIRGGANSHLGLTSASVFLGRTPNTSPYRGRLYSSSGGLPQPPGWNPH